MSKLGSIRGLRTFCIAAKHLSFKKAAAQLYLTPSAVSHQVKQLEEKLGIPLFERQTRAMELTQVGHQFYKAIQPLVSELESTISEFTFKDKNVSLSISMPEFFASEMFVPKLGQWSSSHPEIQIQLETVKSNQSNTKPCDLSVVLSNSEPSSGNVHELFSLCYWPGCHQELYNKWYNKGYPKLNAVPLLVHQARPWAWHQWADRALIENFEPKQIIQLDSMLAIVRAAQQGMGLALIPMPIGKAWFEEKQLFKIFDDDLITNDRYFIVQHEEIKSQQAICLFIDWLKKIFQGIA